MLLIQNEHIVVGREEIPFEDTYRTELVPGLAKDEGTRLCGFFWSPHGAGEGYEAVTLIAVANVEALERHQKRLATGDLADCWLALEGTQRHIRSTLNLVTDWSSFAKGGLDEFAVGEHPTALFRLDSLSVPGPVAQTVDDLASNLAGSNDGDVVTTLGCWSPFLGDLDEPVVTVLSRIRSDEALQTAFSKPALPWQGVPEVPGALRTTRLLRSVSWSPLH